MLVLGTLASQNTKSFLNDFAAIQTVTGTGSSGTITFSSIPSAYKHLQLRIIAAGSAGNAAATINFNGDANSNYAYHFTYGTGSTPGSSGGSSDTTIRAAIRTGGSTANVMGVSIVDILDYTDTNKYKTVRVLTGRHEASPIASIASGLWMSTAAISSISFSDSGAGNWTTKTKFMLYGIKG